VDSTHVVLLAGLGVIVAIAAFGFWKISQALRKDEAIDAATFLALKDLRERFQRTGK
jgi:hypothetical protein